MGPLGATRTCTHIPREAAGPRAEACEACASSYNLRACAHCGFVGCCESQAGHNREHALAAGHPVLRSLPLDRHSFTWCYECRRYVDAPDATHL
jgi:uncharacterized UBP type Zn finger protein